MEIDTSRLSRRPSEAPKAEAAPPTEPAPPVQAAAVREPLSWDQVEDFKNQVIAALCTCYDPEIPVNVYELGLIYAIEISPEAAVSIRMTLTSPACPVAGSLPPEIERKIRAISGVTGAKAEVVWDPPWDKSRMSEAARLQLGIDD